MTEQYMPKPHRLPVLQMGRARNDDVDLLFGLVNGLLVTRIKLPPFIVTLGTFNIAFAITQLYSGSQTVTEVPALMTWLGSTFPLGGTNVAYGTVLMILLYLGVWFWLRETPSGRHVYAVGNNPEATRLVGIPPERVILGVYALSGVFYGIASLLAFVLAVARHEDAMRDGAHDAQIVADEEIAQPVFLLEVFEQFDDLGLHG